MCFGVIFPLALTVTFCYWSHGPVESSWDVPLNMVDLFIVMLVRLPMPGCEPLSTPMGLPRWHQLSPSGCFLFGLPHYPADNNIQNPQFTETVIFSPIWSKHPSDIYQKKKTYIYIRTYLYIYIYMIYILYIYVYLRNLSSRFPTRRVPPVIIHFWMGFSIVNHPATGYLYFWNPPYHRRIVAVDINYHKLY